MSDEFPENRNEAIELLDLAAYSKKAREGGGQILYDEAGQSTGERLALDEATVEQDRVILRNFAAWTVGFNQQTDHPQRIADLSGLSALISAWPESLGARGLKVATIERYMVTMRRYARYRGLPDSQFKRLTPRNSRPRGPAKLIEVSEIEGWLELTETRDRLVLLASWLLLSRVPVGKLPQLVYGKHLTLAGTGQVTIHLDNRDLETSVTAARILADSWCEGEPVLAVRIDAERALRSSGGLKVGDVVPVPAFLLRKRWERLRGTGSARGPVMRELLGFGRVYYVDLVDGELNISWRVPPSPS